MLRITHPNYCNSEREYIFQVIFSEFLGLPCVAKTANTHELTIKLDGKSLVINDDFFSIAKDAWLSPESLPQQPLELWNTDLQPQLDINISTPSIPVIYGKPSISIDDHSGNLGIDIFGSSFFMLSRYEEAIKLERDQYDRFPATASLAYQESYLDRPIVNEYVEILWAGMKKLWPKLKRKKRQFAIIPTHDVDLPYCIAGRPLSKTIRFIAAEAIKRKQYKTALKYLLKIPQIKAGHSEDDPFNTFDWLMKKNEENNLKSTFFFFSNKSGEFVHGDYSLKEPLIKSLIHNIYNRGHEIGLHGSLNSYTDPHKALKESNTLMRFCEKEKIIQTQWGVRQHFLRWQLPETFEIWENIGLDYDSTLGFADIPGFRCGTCYDFPAYDIKERKQLKIRERPLIAMESSILNNRYMGMGSNIKSFGLFSKLKENCRQFNGQFILLWHNSYLVDQAEKELYEHIIQN